MPSEMLVLDPLEENAANVPLDLFADPFVVTQIRTPTPPLQPRWAVPDDADGDALVASRYQNREIVIGLEIVPADATSDARAATAQEALAQLADKITKINREQGTLRRTLPTGDAQTFDLITADQIDPTWDVEWETARVLTLELRFVAKPFWRGVEISGTADAFAADTTGDYTVTGSGSAISGGRVVVSSTSAKTWLHNARTFIDGTVTVGFTTGASVAAWAQQVIGKATDANNHLSAQITNAGALAIVKTVGGRATTLASTAGANLSTTTVYWLRLVMVSNVVTGELWTADPFAGGRPARSVSWTLAGGDVGAYGEGVAGRAGFAMTPGDTGWTCDDFSALWMAQEKALPALVMTVLGADGDVPALGRWVVTDVSGSDQSWLVWGMQRHSYDSAATAALFYEAETRTPLGSAAVATVTGASGGASSNAVTETGVMPIWAAVLSTQAAGAGPHLTHVGDYRVFARVQRPTSNTGTVSVAFEWALGDFRSSTRNPTVVYAPNEVEGSFTVIDLGTVSIPAGTPQWEGRVIAKSTRSKGDQLIVDCLWLVPTEASAEVASVLSTAAPTTFVAHDEFENPPSILNGRALLPSGSWSIAGDTTDGSVSGGYFRRSAGSDTDYFFGLAGATSLARVSVQANTSADSTSLVNSGMGVFARWVDVSNWLGVKVPTASGTSVAVSIVKKLAGAESTLWTGAMPGSGGFSLNDNYAVRLSVFENGYWILAAGYSVVGQQYVAVDALDSGVVASGFDADLALGGALATGRFGLLDWNFTVSTTQNRYYLLLAAWSPPADAAIFASRSTDLTYAAATREDATGSLSAPSSRYAGDRFFVPVRGPEQARVRLLTKASRATPPGPDLALDDISAQLHVTPRYLVVP